MEKKFLFIMGTRPEVIKLAPVIHEALLNNIDFKVCISGQHKEMITDLIKFFNIKPDFVIPLAQENRTLSSLTADLTKSLEKIIKELNPSHIVIQGDTTTALCGALVGFYNKVKIAHIEAGLRTNNKFSPFPEEINRRLISEIADIHFVVTEKGKINLEREGIVENVFVVGNTVIDSLFLTLDIIEKENLEKEYIQKFKFIDWSKKIILFTAHRRESLGKPIREIYSSLIDLANNFRDIQIVYPVHLNPEVRNTAFHMLKGRDNIFLIEPLNYPEFVWLMGKSYFIITDSGGIQEEAPSLNKPVLVIRNVTEREEVVEIGAAKLVGTNRHNILKECSSLLVDKEAYIKMINHDNPYGDGGSSKRIVEKLSFI